MRLVLIVALLLPALPTLAEPGECRAHGDCRIVAPGHCCTGCAGEPQAVSTRWRPPACGCAFEPPEGGCPPVASPGDFVARCERGRCIRVARRARPGRPAPPQERALGPGGSPAVRCDRDEQCFVDTWNGCCNPCPGPPRALSSNPAGAACSCALRRTPPGKSPCPAVERAAKYRAACRAHRCVLLPR